MVAFDDQTVVDAAGDDDLAVNATLDDGAGADSDTRYVVNLHERDNGTPGAFVGTTEVVTGEVTGQPLVLEDTNGDSVSINETGTYIAMIHIVDDDTTEETLEAPGAFPVLQHTSTDGVVSGGVTDAGTVSVVTLTLNEQATASSTLTDENVTEPGVVVEDVSADTDSAILLVAPGDENPVIVGIEQRSAEELDGTDVVVPVENTTGFPGVHEAVLVPQDNLSSEYEPGDIASTETGSEILTGDAAIVSQGTVEFDEQEYVNNTSTVTVSTTDLAPTDQYVVVVHETAKDGSVGDPIGSSANLTGTQTNADIPVDEINATDEYVAMLHFPAADGAYSGAIPNADATAGFVNGSVADVTTVTILTPAESDLETLDVDGQGANGTIVAGDNESVAVNVTNRGEEVSDFEVTLDIEGQESVNQTSAAVGLNETDTVTFENVTGDLAAGEYNVTVSTADDELTGNLTVQTPADPALADLEIAGQGDSAEIVAGDDEPVAVNVTNDGEEVSDFDVTLDVEGAANVTRTSEELGLDETDTVTFEGATTDLEAGEYNVSVTTGDANVSGDLTVLTAAESEFSALDIAEQNDSAEIVAGDDESVTANVTNVGDETGAVTVELLVDEEVTDTVRVTDLSSAETETVTFASATGDLAAGDYDVTVRTADDTTTGHLSVLTPAESDLTNLDIAGQSDSAELIEGDNESVAVDVTNLGEEVSDFEVTLDIEGEDNQIKTTDELGLDHTDSIVFENATGDLAAGNYNVTVSTADDEVDGNLTVYTPVEDGQSELSDLDIAGQSDSATIVHGDDETISANVTNNGTADGAVAVELATDDGDTVLGEQIVEVASDETVPVAFENATGDLAAGEYTVTVSTADDELTGHLTVQTPAEANLTDLDIAGQSDSATIVHGDDEPVAVNVTNLGEEVSTFDVTLTVGDHTETITTGELGLDHTETVTFESATGDLDAGEYDVDVSTADGASVTGHLTVQTPA
ncbi:hypothetical protein DJ74_00340, partial [Halorubrum sp. Ea8]